METKLEWETIWSKKDHGSSKSISISTYRGYKVTRKKGWQLTKYKNYKNWEDYYIEGVTNRYYSTEYSLMAVIDELIKNKEEGTNGK